MTEKQFEKLLRKIEQNDKSRRNDTGKSFLYLLTLLFICLKLTGTISWSWGWVLSPIWIPWALMIAFLIIMFVVGAMVVLLGGA